MLERKAAATKTAAVMKRFQLQLPTVELTVHVWCPAKLVARFTKERSQSIIVCKCISILNVKLEHIRQANVHLAEMLGSVKRGRFC